MSVLRIVVGAAIVRDGALLAARRSAPSQLAGGWELPGGKVEAGESEQEALIRECREELGIEIAVGERVVGEWPLGTDMVLRVHLATLADGEPTALQDHDELRWLSTAELYDVDWLPGDLPAVVVIADHLTTSR